jgi:hypothetical protein
MPTLPEQALKVGDSFDVKVPMTLSGPGGKGEKRAEAVWTYTLRSLDAKAAKFDVKQTIPETTTDLKSPGSSLALSGSGKGTATFSLKDGMFSEILMDSDFQMAVDVPPPAGGSGANGGSAAGSGAPPAGIIPANGLRLKTNIKGPVTMTLTPAAK